MLGGWPGTARRSACPPRGGGTVTGRVLTPGGQCTSRPVRGHHPSRRRAHAERPKCQGPINIGREPPRREPCSKCQGGSERPGRSPCLLKGGPSHLHGLVPIASDCMQKPTSRRTHPVLDCLRMTGSATPHLRGCCRVALRSNPAQGRESEPPSTWYRSGAVPYQMEELPGYLERWPRGREARNRPQRRADAGGGLVSRSGVTRHL